MLMILARLARSESFWAVAKVRSPHNGPEVSYPRISVTIDGPPENSSPFERGPGPRSKSEEFSGGPSIVTEIWPLKV